MINHRNLPQTSGIYKIYFLNPDAFYIGSAVNLRQRCRNHLNELRKGTHHNPHLQNAFTLYGIDTLHFVVVELVEQRSDLLIREQFYLDTLNPHYNISQGATAPRVYPIAPRTRAKLRARMIGNKYRMGLEPHNKGKTYSPEDRAKMSADQMGKKHSPGTRAKQSARQKGKPSGITGKSSRKKGTKLSPEAKEQMRLKGRATRSAKGNPPSPKKGTHLSPEVRARALEKRRANKAAKKAKEQDSLWGTIFEA